MTGTSSLGALAAIVCLGFAVEAAFGFGATVVTVALAANLVAIDELLAAFVPLNICLSAFLVYRGRRHVAFKALVLTILPPMVLGLPIGLYALGSLDAKTLRIAFGVFVFLLSAIELVRVACATRAGTTPPSPRKLPVLDVVLLVIGGVVHGAFATGGPMAVYVAGKRLGEDRAAFRATLSTLWLLLNAILVVTYAAEQKLGMRSLATTAVLTPSLLIGLALGNMAHSRLPERAFRIGIFVLLAVAAGVLVARAAT